MKVIKDNTNRWRVISCSWTGRTNIVKVTILPKAICKFNAISIKLSMTFFSEIEQNILQFVWEQKKIPNSQSNLEKEKTGGINLPVFRLY